MKGEGGIYPSETNPPPLKPRLPNRMKTYRSPTALTILANRGSPRSGS